MFELLGLCLLLAALLTFNSFASLMTAGAWRVLSPVVRNSSATTRAQLLFALRVVPALLSIAIVLTLLVPAYLLYEPRHTTEQIGLKLEILALVSAVGLGLAISRAVGAWRATERLTADWLRHAVRIDIDGISIPTFCIEHVFPVIAIVGIRRPRLFVARQVLDLLSVDEIAAAIAHENSHLQTRDNFKRGFLRACRDALLMTPCGRLLDRAWSDAAEEAADEGAARKGETVALDLASALVKIARTIPNGARPAMPAGMLLVGDTEDRSGIRSRVRRLMDLAANKPGSQRATSSLPIIGIVFCALTITVMVANNAPVVFPRVHALIEYAVLILK
ncbi:MAG: hypothetical protein ABR555_00085 [Pyrinomonadaceae bacterium]